VEGQFLTHIGKYLGGISARGISMQSPRNTARHKEPRLSRGRIRKDALFPVAPAAPDLPRDYAATLTDIRQRIRRERLRTVLAANSSMTLLYWDVGRLILNRQEKSGWGAKIIDRLSVDLRKAYPDMQGLSARNLKYMRAFAAAWPRKAIVQGPLAQITWYHFPGTADPRREKEVEQALVDHIQCFLLELGAGFAFVGRQVPLEVGDQGFHLDLLFYHLKLRCYVVNLSAVDDLLKHPHDKPTIGLLLCRTRNKLVVEYALRNLEKPIGVAGWETRLVEELPEELKGSLPTVAEIEAELGG
jgi:predicted nuclease of restriction endonuclease-like (RecB) superfamily